MKTTKFIFAVSLALIFAAGFELVNAQKSSEPINPVVIKSHSVTYLVKVATRNFNPVHGEFYMVMMTDETGKAIAETQAYIPGKTDYIFREPGPVRGTRVARLVKLPIGPRSYSIRPAIRTGVFLEGVTYIFVIVPLPYAMEAVVDIH